MRGRAGALYSGLDLLIPPFVGASMMERLRNGPMRSKALELGMATERGIEEMIEAWGTWTVTEDAVLGIMNGEAIIHKA